MITRDVQPLRRWLAFSVLILLAGWALRTLNLLSLPLFLDEALHINRAFAAQVGQPFEGLEQNKWLYPVLLAGLRPSGPESAWLARIVSAWFGVLSGAACIGLGRSLKGRTAGLLSGLLYAVAPFAVFHERQALVDPMMSALAALLTLSVVHLMRRPRAWLAALSGLSLAGAYLTKAAALPYFALPIFGLLLTSAPGEAPKFVRRLGAGLAVPLLAALPIAITYQAARAAGVTPTPTHRISLENTAIATAVPSTSMAYDVGTYAAILWVYLGPLVLMLLLLGLLSAVRSKVDLRAVLYLSVPALAFGLVPLLAERPTSDLVARYLLITVPPLVVLGGMGWAWLLDVLRAWRTTGWAMWVVGLLILGPALWFDAVLLISPRSAPLHSGDRLQYITGDPSGYGHAQIAAHLLAAHRSQPGGRVHFMSTGSLAQVQAYLGPAVSEAQRLHPGRPEQAAVLAGWLAAGDRVFIILDEDQVQLAFDAPHGLLLEGVGQFPSGGGDLALYRVTGARDQLAADIYARMLPALGPLDDDMEALAAALPPTGVNYVFPMIEGQSPAVEAPHWPLQQAEAAAAVSALDVLTPGRTFSVTVVDEARTDPQRYLASALMQRFYWFAESWEGLLHARTYTAGPADLSLDDINASFEAGISLDQAAVELVRGPQPLLLIVIRWQAGPPVEADYQRFIHVVDASGALVAQLDSVPGGGLLPTSGWAGAVEERAAVLLPADLPAGRYQVRVGLYSMPEGVRLNRADPAQGDFALIGTFVYE